jgi:hypothetical protein
MGWDGTHRAVLGAGDEDGEARVEEDGGDVVGVALQHLHAGLGLVVPDPHLACECVCVCVCCGGGEGSLLLLLGFDDSDDSSSSSSSKPKARQDKTGESGRQARTWLSSAPERR